MWPQQDGKGPQMAWRHQQAFRTGRLLALACLTVLAAPAGVAAAGERSASLGEPPAPERPIYVTVGESTRPPVGWVEFCIEYRSECASQPSAPRDVVLTPKAWSDMLKVNAWVNQSIRPMTDIEHWGVVERWNYPDDGYGDCEDYVLLKRRLLIQAGWPREALLVTVVRDANDDAHAVLTVSTDKGDYILDNQNANVLLWSETGYRFVKRQSQSSGNVWVSLGDPQPTPVTATSP